MPLANHGVEELHWVHVGLVFGAGNEHGIDQIFHRPSPKSRIAEEILSCDGMGQVDAV